MKIFFSPKLGLDIAGAGRSRLYFFLLLFPQDPFGEQEISGRDVVVPVGFQGSEENKGVNTEATSAGSDFHKQNWLCF